MKIKYSMPSNLFEFMYESNNIAGNRNKLYQAKKSLNINSFNKDFWVFIGYLILFIIEIVFYIKTGVIFALILSVIFGFVVFILGICIIAFIYFYFKTKNSILDGKLIINKDGIIDEDCNVSVTCKWEGISYILIGKLSINIFLDNGLKYLRLPINIKEELLNAIDKYSKVELIDLVRDK